MKLLGGAGMNDRGRSLVGSQVVQHLKDGFLAALAKTEQLETSGGTADQVLNDPPIFPGGIQEGFVAAPKAQEVLRLLRSHPRLRDLKRPRGSATAAREALFNEQCPEASGDHAIGTVLELSWDPCHETILVREIGSVARTAQGGEG